MPNARTEIPLHHQFGPTFVGESTEHIYRSIVHQILEFAKRRVRRREISINNCASREVLSVCRRSLQRAPRRRATAVQQETS
jgi:hypothetical protein